MTWPIINPLPGMSGSADAPKTVKVGEIFDYVIKQKDIDIASVMSQPKEVPDPTAQIRPYRLTSFYNFQYRWDLAGVEGDGTRLWRVTGRAVFVPGTYIDTWVLVNARWDGDIAIDPPFPVSQVVIVQPN